MTNRLRLKVTLGTALILSALFLVLGMYLIKSQRIQLIHNMRDHGNHIASLTARSSAEYIQRYSFFLMEDQAMSIEQSEDIAFCEIYDAEDKPLLQSGNIVSKDHAGKQKAQYGKDILVVSQPIMAGETLLGRVEIGLKLDHVNELIQEKSTHMALLFFGFTLFVVVVLNLFFHKVFIKPVRIITNGTQRVARRDFTPIDVGNRHDDLGLLARNFNQMNQSLQELYEDLEGKVKERTQALKQANTELLLAIDQAKAMAQKAEAGTLAKSQFLAAMSHEIRTPMNAVLGMGEILQDSDLNEEQRRYVNILLESGNALLGLIDDILDLSKIEAGEMVFERTPFSLEDVVNKSFKVTAYGGYQKGIDLEYTIAPNVPSMLRGDPMRLQQILINLLGNGIKFTDKGHVVLDIAMTPKQETDTDVSLTFCVHDTGEGVAPDKVETIFSKFTQADASTTRRHGGTGLGLSICQSLCEKLGGRIWIESQLGQGSSVCFTLPYQLPEGDPIHPPVLRNTRFLLMDDRDNAPRALAARMAQAGAEVKCANTFDQGVSFIKDAEANNQDFDGVIVTVPMQGQDWGAVTATLIEGGIPLDNVILLMGNGVEQVSPRHPFGGVLAKPASIAELKEVFDGTSFTRTTNKPETITIPLPDDRPLSILLVEDSTANSMLIELYLKDSDHQLTVAENGEVGLEQFSRKVFDIVFMDVEMPVMDGFECTRRIRQWEADNGRPAVPIVALTAHALKEVKERILDAGCTTYLTKPIGRKNFLRAISANGLSSRPD